MTIHFSIDDVIGCFKYLTCNQSQIDSIFDLRLFSFAKFLHNTYGIDISLYCMYTDGKYILSETPDKWKREFMENSSWLKLGFHGYGSSSNYKMATKEELSLDYDYVLKELIRITGSERSIAKIIRLHFFAGNKSALSVLSEKGVDGLLCADDNRGSYYLTWEMETAMRENGLYYDAETDLTFYPTHIRIEKFTGDVSFTDFGKIAIFTHEKYFDDDAMRCRIIDVMHHLKTINSI